MRILGMEIGSSSIKAVEVDSAFGKIEIHEYYEQPVEAGTPVSEALTLLLQKLSKRPDRVAVCYPSSKTTFRNLLIPSRDKKTIRARVAFELEDELPFALEDCIYDYVILDQNIQGSNVHIESTLIKNAQDVLTRLQLATFEPDLMVSESWAWRALLNRVLTAESLQRPRLLVHIGQTRTLLYLQWKNIPLLSREISWGKAQITPLVASAAGEPNYSTELALALQPLCSEIRQIRLASQSVTDELPAVAYISGEAALYNGLPACIQDETHVPTEILRPMSSLAAGLTYTEHTDVVFGPALAAALCQAFSNKSPSINFRKNSLAKTSSGPKIEVQLLKKPMLAAASVLTTLILSLTIQSAVYQSRMKDTDVQLEKSIRYFFGQVTSSSVKNFISSPSSLKSSIQKELEKQRELASLFTPNNHSPLEFVKTLSVSVPKDVVVDMTQIQVGAAPGTPFAPDAEQSASLTFQIANPQIAEKLSQLLADKMPDLKRGPVEEAAGDDPTTKRWKITFSGKAKEQDYGK